MHLITSGPTNLGLIYSPEADDYNYQSAHVQALSGVNPDECLQVGVFQGNEPAPNRLLLDGLGQRLWISPSAGHFSTAEINNNWGATRRMHPSAVGLVVQSANIGQEFYAQGMIEDGENVARRLRDFISLWAKIEHFEAILGISKPTEVTSYEKLLRHQGLVWSHEHVLRRLSKSALSR